MNAFRTRFAPSPTFYLHLGHAASALHVWQAAEEAGGEVLLRIEDIDTTRCRSEYTQQIYADLEWLGLTWPEPVRVQSDHFTDYQACVATLNARGLAYRCFRTRTELSNFPDPMRPGPHSPDEERRSLEAKLPFAWRLSLAAAKEALGADWNALSYLEQTAQGVHSRPANPSLHGDIIIARKDSPSAYHLAATHDDALQGMTHIIRGEDLIDAPHIHTLLQALMRWPQPIYHHHPLILDADGRKLSKREKSISLKQLRADGVTPEQIKKRLGFG